MNSAETPLPNRQVEQHILCVDDDPDFLTSIEFFLPQKVNHDEGGEVWYRFLFFENPTDALNTLKELTASRETVAMVISDQKMPQMRGTELLDHVKKISPESVRVLLTGNAGLESAIMAINNQLLDKYLTKPIDDEHDFVVSIQQLLQSFQMKRTIADQNKIIRNLYNFSNILNAIEDFQKTLDYIVTFTRESLKCEQIALMLFEEGALHIKAAKGLPEEALKSIRIPIEAKILQDIFRPGKVVLGRTVLEVPYLKWTLSSQSQSFFHTPLLYAGLLSAEGIIGVINVSKKIDCAPFLNTDFQYLTHIADTASIAIQNLLNRSRLQEAYVKTKMQADALDYQTKHGGSRSPGPSRTKKEAA